MPDDTKPRLRVASYNMRAGLGTDLRRRPERVLETIASLGADVVALQEADFRTGARPSALPLDQIERLTGLRPVPMGREGSLGWHGNALLARPELAVEETTLVDLPGLEPRGAVFARFGGPLPLRMVAVHLGLLRRSRRRQLSHLTEALAAGPDHPTLIVGDFNEWSRKVGLGRLLPDYSILTPPPTFPASRPFGALDRMAYSPDIRLRPIEVSRKRGPHASDHLPILAEATWAA